MIHIEPTDYVMSLLQVCALCSRGKCFWYIMPKKKET